MSPKILLVDDVPARGRITGFLLMSWGFDVCTATCGQEAMDVVATETLALVVAAESVRDGAELIAFVRAGPAAARAPILVSAGRAGPTSRLAREADGVIAIGADALELQALVESLLEDADTEVILAS